MSRLPSLALRNVGRNARRSLLTALTIVVGVAMMIVVRSVTLGMANLMTEDTVQARLGALQVHRAGFVDNIDAVPLALNLPSSEELRQKLLAVPHVAGVSGRITFNGLVSNGVAQTMFVGRGLDLRHELEACPKAKQQVNRGEMLAPGDQHLALVGYELAESFGLQPGGTFMVSSSSPLGRANTLDLRAKGFTVSSFPFENKRVVTVPLETAQALLGLEGRVTEYAVALDDLEHLDQVAQQLRETLGPDYEVHVWSELQPFFRDLLNRIVWVLGSVATVLLVVVLTGIINTMLMSVFERVREIGTLLAVGVRRRQVMAIFLIEGMAIGLLGGLLGAVIGRTIVAALHAKGIAVDLAGMGARMLRPTVPLGFVATAVLVAMAGTFLATLWPAWRASRLNPVDALRAT